MTKTDTTTEAVAALLVPEVRALVGAVDNLPRDYESEYDGRTYYRCSSCEIDLSETSTHKAHCDWLAIDAAIAALKGSTYDKN